MEEGTNERGGRVMKPGSACVAGAGKNLDAEAGQEHEGSGGRPNQIEIKEAIVRGLYEGTESFSNKGEKLGLSKKLWRPDGAEWGKELFIKGTPGQKRKGEGELLARYRIGRGHCARNQQKVEGREKSVERRGKVTAAAAKENTLDGGEAWEGGHP